MSRARILMQMHVFLVKLAYPNTFFILENSQYNEYYFTLLVFLKLNSLQKFV